MEKNKLKMMDEINAVQRGHEKLQGMTGFCRNECFAGVHLANQTAFDSRS